MPTKTNEIPLHASEQAQLIRTKYHLITHTKRIMRLRPNHSCFEIERNLKRFDSSQNNPVKLIYFKPSQAQQLYQDFKQDVY